MSSRVFVLIPICLLLEAQAATAQVSQQANRTRLETLQLTTGSDGAKAEFWTGLDAWQNFGYTEAQRHFERALALDSSFGLARAFIAEAAVQRGFPLRSNEMDRAVADATHGSIAEAVLALAWREKALGRDRSAATLLRAAMELLPNEPHLASEYVWASAGYDLKAALDAARAARAAFPTFAALSPAFSYVLLQSGDTAGALGEAKRYAELDSTRPVSFVFYGQRLQSLGHLTEAEAQYLRALTLGPPPSEISLDPRVALASVMELQGKTESARVAASEGLRGSTSTRDSVRYLQLLAGTQLFANDPAAALRSFAQFGQLWPKLGIDAGLDPSGLYSALIDAAFGNGRSVPKFLSDVHPRAPGDTVPIEFSLAGIYGYAGTVDSTFKYADKLAARAATNSFAAPLSHFARGEAYLKSGRCEKALEHFRQSDSTWIEVQAGIAECELQLGHRDLALHWQNLALANRQVNLLDPGEIHARVRMTQLPWGAPKR
jgi:tetratricopeptide (TPR) repeat protein